MPLFKYKPSLSKKVGYAYYICLYLIVGVAVLNYFDLKSVENTIILSDVISEFSDTTLEIRRFEKNYFLYRQKDDYLENLRFLKKAEDIIKKKREAFEGLVSVNRISNLEATLQEYKNLIVKYASLDITGNSIEALKLERTIREKGREIILFAENLSAIARNNTQAFVLSSQWTLIISIVFLCIIGCLVGQLLSRMVMKPLKMLEESMKQVANGRFNSISITTTDSEIISLNRAFNRTLKELELRQMKFSVQSGKLASLGTMTSGIAHQLNNPLSNISTSCQILLEELEDQDIRYKKELLQQIEEQVERAKTMVHSLLEFSRKKEFKRDTLLLSDLIENILRLIRGDIPTKVEIKVDIPKDICLIADRQMIEGAFLNIIKNGIEAIPDEGMVSISANKDIETKTIDIRIRDTGLGIEPECLEKIFDPFYTTKSDEKGTGLGLFVAREIIKEHEGLIEIDSTIDQGTTFTIKLPLKEL
ncbi:MAG: HAMP domain-containing sensor histidine kinase [Nitrospirota bacterium]